MTSMTYYTVAFSSTGLASPIKCGNCGNYATREGAEKAARLWVNKALDARLDLLAKVDYDTKPKGGYQYKTWLTGFLNEVPVPNGLGFKCTFDGAWLDINGTALSTFAVEDTVTFRIKTITVDLVSDDAVADPSCRLL